MNNNYKIIRTIFENVFQRVLECKDNDTGEIFYNNVITNKRVINLINIDVLNSLNSNILDCCRIEDRIYIFTKSLEAQGRSLKEYVINNNLSLKKQFALSKKTIELASDLFNLTDVVQQKILDLNKIHVDENDNLIVDCNLVFEQEYDIQDNETFKRMGNMLHYIFSGTEIVDYNISESVPPDMLKIIVRCLTKEYIYPNDALTELVNSPIYNMVSAANAKVSKVKQKTIPPNFDKVDSLKIDEADYDLNKDESSDNIDEDVLNIYLRDNNNNSINDNLEENNSKKNIKHSLSNKDIKRAGVSILLIAFVLMIGSHFINKISNNSEKVLGKNADVTQSTKKTDDNVDNVDNVDNDEIVDKETFEAGSTEIGDESLEEIDSISKFLNKDLLQSIGYTGSVAETDNDIFVEGKKSLVVINDGEEKVKALFAAIDFTDPNYSYMLKKQIGVATKIKSENDLSSLIVLEAYKDGKLASTFHTTVQIYNDMWSQNIVAINVTNADFLNIYIEYSGKNKVWIDSIYIDVVK